MTDVERRRTENLPAARPTPPLPSGYVRLNDLDRLPIVTRHDVRIDQRRESRHILAIRDKQPPVSRRGRPSEHTCSRWRLTPVSIHASRCRQPPPDENSIPPATWPPRSTGASQSPRLSTPRSTPLAAPIRDQPEVAAAGPSLLTGHLHAAI